MLLSDLHRYARVNILAEISHQIQRISLLLPCTKFIFPHANFENSFFLPHAEFKKANLKPI